MFDTMILAADNVKVYGTNDPDSVQLVTMVVTDRFEKLLAVFHGHRQVWCAKSARKA